IVVDDGSTDGTFEKGKHLEERQDRVRLLRHESRQGTGACLRTALSESKYSLFFYSALDYPYTPADIGKLLDRIGRSEEVSGRLFEIQIVNGCRTGRTVPLGWRIVGWFYRSFMRVVVGNPVPPVPSWLGFSEHWKGWTAWLVFGNPLEDVNSSFKLIHRSILERFPIQSNGDMVHAELIAKATFTTCMMDEVPLTPNPAPPPPVRWNEFWQLLRNAKFRAPSAPTQINPV